MHHHKTYTPAIPIQKSAFQKPKLSKEQEAVQKLTKKLHKLFPGLKLLRLVHRNKHKADIRKLISESFSHTSNLIPHTSRLKPQTSSKPQHP